MDVRITSWDKLQHNPFLRNGRNVPQEFSGTAATDMTEWDWWALADREGGVVQQLDLRVGPAEDDVENDVREAVEELLTDLVHQIIAAEEVAALEVLDKFVKRGNA